MTQRTPPSSPKYSSDPDLSRMMQTEFVSMRKRKQRPEVEEWNLLHSDILNMFQKLSSDQEAKFKQLTTTIEEVSEQNKMVIAINQKLENTLDKTLKIYEDLKKSVQLISEKHQEAIVRIEHLEQHIEYMQRQNLSSTLEISNLPKTVNEDLNKVVNKVHNILGLSIKKEEVAKAYRITASKRNTVVVQYMYDRTRNEVLMAVRDYNKKNAGKAFNANSVDSSWKEDTLYFSEALTPHARSIFFAARNFKKSFNYKYCWSARGKIFLKKTEGSPAILYWKLNPKGLTCIPHTDI